MTSEEEIALLKERMLLMEQNLTKLVNIVGLIAGVPQERLDEAARSWWSDAQRA